VLDVQKKGMPGTELGDIVGLDELPPIDSNYSYSAPTKRVMDELGRTYGFYWSIQNGALEIIKRDKYINQVTRITPDTGMISTPSVTDKGISFQCLLDPSVRPNRVVELWSPKMAEQGIDGKYRVSAAKYSGSNRDGQYLVECEAELISGGVAIDEGSE